MFKTNDMECFPVLHFQSLIIINKFLAVHSMHDFNNPFIYIDTCIIRKTNKYVNGSHEPLFISHMMVKQTGKGIYDCSAEL